MTKDKANEIICTEVNLGIYKSQEDEDRVSLICNIAEVIDLINGALDGEYDIYDLLPEIKVNLANAWLIHEDRFLRSDDLYFIAQENINEAKPVMFTDEFFLPDMTGKTVTFDIDIEEDKEC